MIDVLIGLILALIMFGIGLSLLPTHFQFLVRHPKVLFLGLFLQLCLLPAIAFGVSIVLNLPPAFATGIVILSACPGGLTSNFISYLLKADTALAVSLTICNTSLSMLTIPIIVNLGLLVFWTGPGVNQLPVYSTAVTIFAVVLVPVLAGMLYRRQRKPHTKRLQLQLRYLSIGLLAVLFSLKLFAPAESGGSELSLNDVYTILPASILINLAALGSGRIFGRVFGFGRNAQLTLGVEAGIQNTSLAFMITSTLLMNEEMLKPALVYAMFTFFTALIYGLYLKPGAWRNVFEIGND